MLAVWDDAPADETRATFHGKNSAYFNAPSVLIIIDIGPIIQFSGLRHGKRVCRILIENQIYHTWYHYIQQQQNCDFIRPFCKKII